MKIRSLLYFILAGLVLFSFPSCEEEKDEDPKPKSNNNGSSDGKDMGDGEGTKVIKNNITEATTLNNHLSDENKADYEICSKINVEADLKIEKGVKIVFCADSRIDVNSSGSFNAVGTKDKPVIITGKAESEGFWQYININSNNPLNVMEYVKISYGGGSWKNSMVHVNSSSSAQVSIKNCTFSNSKKYGIYAEGGVDLSGFSSNIFENNKGPGLRITAKELGYVDSASDFNNNGEKYIYVASNSIDNSSTIAAADVPYLIDGINLNADLTINGGVNIMMNNQAKIDVNSNGSFNAVGTENDSITIKGKINSKGYWKYINVNSNNPKNKLEYINFSDGGGDWKNSMVHVNSSNNARISIANCRFSNSEKLGIYAESGTNLEGFSNNAFSNNGDAGLRITLDHVGYLDGASDYDDNNQNNYILVSGGLVTEEATWPSTDAPVLLNNNNKIKAAVTVAEGATINMGSGARIDVESGGSFNAVGSSSNRITITGKVESAGYWDYININSNNPDNQLKYVDLSYGGGSWKNSIVHVNSSNNGKVEIKNCSIENSNKTGIFVESGATIIPSDPESNGNNTFSGNQNNVVFQ